MNSDKFSGSLFDQLAAYAAGDACPMHMPGHKRKALGSPLPLELDITEITGFDNLHEARGILRQGMDRAARLWGSRRAYYLINGSSGGILAGIAAAAAPGSRVILARGCHKSVYHALELRGLRPVYLQPAVDPAFGVAGSVQPDQLAAALDAHSDAKLVILTSPTYEGVVSDIAALAALCHRRGIPLLVDEAHGAHLGFDPAFPAGAVACGADIVVQSLHKTLPSPTQTALLHLCSDRVSAEGLERQLAVFQTSSPSYLLMGGIDFCLRMVEQEGPALFAAYAKRLATFDETIRPLARLRVLCHGADSPAAHPGFFAFDPGKLVISTRYAGRTGGWLKDRLREEYGIELEMAMGDYALAMTSVCDEDRDLDRLARALLEMDRELEAAPCPPNQPFLPLPQVVLDPAAARQQETELCDLAQAQGRLAGEMVWAYPPGVPLLVPGERIGSPQLEALDRLTRQEVELHSESGFVPKKIRVLAPRY